MISGRGLGHTGGTLDKAESIPGFRCDVDGDQFVRMVHELGVCLAGQTGPPQRNLLSSCVGTDRSSVRLCWRRRRP